jgi:hypothetical protein
VLGGKFLTTGDYTGTYANPVANFFFGDPNSHGRVGVVAKNADGDMWAEVVSGSRKAARTWSGSTPEDPPPMTGESPESQDIDPFGEALPGAV